MSFMTFNVTVISVIPKFNFSDPVASMNNKNNFLNLSITLNSNNFVLERHVNERLHTGIAVLITIVTPLVLLAVFGIM